MLYRHFSTFFSVLRIISILCLGIFSNAYAQYSSDIQHILDGVNHFRMRHLLMPLKLDLKMSAIAAIHSQDMAHHICPFGHSGWAERFLKIRNSIPNTIKGGENVAYGYKDIDSVITGWTHSPGHRANILGSYNLTGIAIAYDDRHRPYYTQVFAYQRH